LSDKQQEILDRLAFCEHRLDEIIETIMIAFDGFDAVTVKIRQDLNLPVHASATEKPRYDVEKVKWISTPREGKEPYDKATKQNNQGNKDYEELVADLKSEVHKDGTMFRGNYFYKLFTDNETVGRFKTHRGPRK
jgi:hypothetical protein